MPPDAGRRPQLMIIAPGWLCGGMPPPGAIVDRRRDSSNPGPEALTRIDIDRDHHLEAASWIVQDRDTLNIHAGPGIAVREVSIPGAGEADELPIAGGKAIGILEAKPIGTTLQGVETRTVNHAHGIPAFLPFCTLPLPKRHGCCPAQ